MCSAHGVKNNPTVTLRYWYNTDVELIERAGILPGAATCLPCTDTTDVSKAEW